MVSSYHTLLLVLLGLVLYSCHDEATCTEEQALQGYQWCINEDKESLHLLFRDEKYLQQDVLLLAGAMVAYRKKWQEELEQEIILRHQRYPDSLVRIDPELGFLKSVVSLYAYETFYDLSNYLLDSVDAEHIIVQNALLKETNALKRYYEGPPRSFVRFMIECFASNYTHDVAALNNHLQLSLLSEVRQRYRYQQDPQQPRVTDQDVYIALRLCQIADPMLDTDALLQKYTTALKNGEIQ